ncbi:DUF4311 domain-containing protein [Enemella sp. A6]|uniref:DUF4311 domain-containing protein n=1 Tax=Enemella sp. A6 TaxID=3440152 RepID=UPI003EBB28CE
MNWIVIIESVIIGALAGFGASAGAARMFHAPAVQGMGAFRTYGEMNACQGDAVAHYSFGLGFLFNAWASVVGAGALTQDVDHRIIPNWAAGTLLLRNKNVAETMHNPKKMAIAGAAIGAVLVAALNSTAAAVPDSLRLVAEEVLVPAGAWLINPVMPVIFWIAAMDAGKRTGMWGTVLGGFAHLVLGNAVPGVVLGILLGKSVDGGGWNRISKVLLIAILVLFAASAFLRGFDIQMLQAFNIPIPDWLISVHETLGYEVKE